MQEKTSAIVLHCLRYNDTSYIANVYTETVGRTSYIIKVSRARNGGVRPSLFHPLALLELEAEGKNTAQLRRVTEARLLHPLHSLPLDPFKSAIALFLGEFLHHALREEGVKPSALRLPAPLHPLARCLRGECRGQFPPRLSHAPVALLGALSQSRRLCAGRLFRPLGCRLLSSSAPAWALSSSRGGRFHSPSHAHELRHHASVCLQPPPTPALSGGVERLLPPPYPRFSPTPLLGGVAGVVCLAVDIQSDALTLKIPCLVKSLTLHGQMFDYVRSDV